MFVIMMNKKILSSILILSIFSALFISGCTFPGGEETASGSGVITENLEVDFPKVYAGEKFKLQMKMSNQGSVDAQNVEPVLFNIEKNAGGKMLEISCLGTCKSDIILLAPDPERGTTGETKTCTWDCRAPSEIPEGLTVTFNPSVRLYYGYATHTVKSITIASQDELRSIQNQGGSLPSETISTTAGSVQLSVIVNGPIRYQENENKITFPINIDIQNTGGGTACDVGNDGCMNTKNWNKVNIVFDREDDSSATLKSCNIADSIQTAQGTQGPAVDLWKGQSATLTCEVDLNIQELSGLVQKNLKFSIYYDYFMDTSTTIEVLGR